MSDTPPDAVETAAPPSVRVLTQYTRDLSFENPRAPDSFRPGQPNIDLGVEMNARGRTDGYFEVDIKLSVKSSIEGEAQFQIELVYGGLFEITGVSEADIEPVLLIECPRFLFPFARRIIADLTTDGGFPPFLLEPIDFAAVYASQRGAASAAAAGQAVN